MKVKCDRCGLSLYWCKRDDCPIDSLPEVDAVTWIDRGDGTIEVREHRGDKIEIREFSDFYIDPEYRKILN
jgi:hypothetical protein